MSTVAERVARGAALLDEKVPGWAGRISLGELDLSSCTFCVLGQLFAVDAFVEPDWDSGYDLGRRVLDLEDDDDLHGFDRYYVEPWSELNAEWRRVITERTARVLAGATT